MRGRQFSCLFVAVIAAGFAVAHGAAPTDPPRPLDATRRDEAAQQPATRTAGAPHTTRAGAGAVGTGNEAGEVTAAAVDGGGEVRGGAARHLQGEDPKKSEAVVAVFAESATLLLGGAAGDDGAGIVHVWTGDDIADLDAENGGADGGVGVSVTDGALRLRQHGASLLEAKATPNADGVSAPAVQVSVAGDLEVGGTLSGPTVAALVAEVQALRDALSATPTCPPGQWRGAEWHQVGGWCMSNTRGPMPYANVLALTNEKEASICPPEALRLCLDLGRPAAVSADDAFTWGLSCSGVELWTASGFARSYISAAGSLTAGGTDSDTKYVNFCRPINQAALLAAQAA